MQKMTFINESNLYKVIFQSRKGEQEKKYNINDAIFIVKIHSIKGEDLWHQILRKKKSYFVSL